MSEYKMSDVFVLPVSSCKGDLFNSKNPLSETRICKFYNMNQFDAAKAGAHAINNHDRLTAQVEELKGFVKQLSSAKVYSVEVFSPYGGENLMDCLCNSWKDKANELLTRIGEDK